MLIKPPEPGDMISVEYCGELNFGVLLKNYFLHDGHPCIKYLPLTIFNRTDQSKLASDRHTIFLDNIKKKYLNENYEHSCRSYGQNLSRRLCKISLDSVNTDKLDLDLLTTVMKNIKREYQNNRPVNAV
jgi:hypothetical protein